MDSIMDSTFLKIMEIFKVLLMVFAFFLAYLGNRLYRKEQTANEPNYNIINSVKRFMWFCIIAAILVGSADFVELFGNQIHKLYFKRS